MSPLVAALAAAASLLLATPAPAAGPTEVDAGRPFVVEVHADWCGTCLWLASTWAQIERDLGGRARVVRFDVTDRASLDRSRAEAQRLGLTDFFESFKGRTGVIAVLDGASGEPLEIRQGDANFGTYAEAVEKAIARAGS